METQPIQSNVLSCYILDCSSMPWVNARHNPFLKAQQVTFSNCFEIVECLRPISINLFRAIITMPQIIEKHSAICKCLKSMQGAFPIKILPQKWQIQYQTCAVHNQRLVEVCFVLPSKNRSPTDRENISAPKQKLKIGTGILVLALK